MVLGRRTFGVGDAHLVGRDVDNLIGERVGTDEMRTQRTCLLVGEVDYLSEVAVLQQVLLVLWSEGIAFVSNIEFRLVAHEMRHELQLVVIVLAE